MSEIQLMSLATQKADWLAARQGVIAQNIANANTPAYQARDLMPFEAVLNSTGLQMAATNAAHLSAGGEGSAAAAIVTLPSGTDQTFNGNSVSLEGEMAKLGETTSQYALSTSIIKSFHKMIMTSLKV